MNTSRVVAARRELRRIRSLDALGQDSPPDNERRYRDILLSELVIRLELDQADDLDGAIIDAAVSVGTSRVNETNSDHLLALMIACETLALDGQFARIHALTAMLVDCTEKLENERPYLAVTLKAFVSLAIGNSEMARRIITVALGVDSPEKEPIQRLTPDWGNIGEVYLATAFRHWLRNGNIDRLQAARSISLRSSDGLLLALTSLVLTYARIASSTSVVGVVSEAAPVFKLPALERYLEGRGIRTLFPAQAAAIQAGILTAGSFLVAMPTSSGKTFLAELRISAELTRQPGRRAIYLAPYKVLAHQVAIEMQNGLSRLGLKVRDMGSSYDFSLNELFQSDEMPDVAVMTPERLDALLRLATSDRRGNEAATDLLDSAALIVIDEIQIIGRMPRGPRIELFLARLRQRLPEVPILGLAAISQGVGQLADWLNAVPVVSQRGRPTGLIELLWNPDGSFYQRFNGRAARMGSLARPKAAIDAAASLVSVIREDRYPILFVETTRAYAENLIVKAAKLSPRDGDRWRQGLTSTQRDLLDSTADIADATLGASNGLGTLIRHGLAYHHAGLPSHLLREIETLIRRRVLRAVGSTTTVAEGADLPFKTVVIPHLNFGTGSSRLNRELYQNIAGRAGRTNVAIEGIVIVLGSDSNTLKYHPQQVLWGESLLDHVPGQLEQAIQIPSTLEEYRAHREARSQVLAWIGEPGSYIEDQGTQFASRTYSWEVCRPSQRTGMVIRFDQILSGLEQAGHARAASPFRLTALGRQARLAGISPESCLRLSQSIQRLDENSIIDSLHGQSDISSDAASLISSLIFETEEVIEQSLWFRRQRFSDIEAIGVLQDLVAGRREWPYHDSIYSLDIQLFSGWIQGEDYTVLSQVPPVFGGRGLFGSDEQGRRASDAADLLGRLAYPASWAWGAVVAMLGDRGDELPSWIRGALEYGVSCETAVELIQIFQISRAGAVQVSKVLSPRWNLAEAELLELSEHDLRSVGMTESDRKAVRLIIHPRE